MKKTYTKDVLEIAENLFIIGVIAEKSGYYLIFKSTVTEQMYYIEYDDPSVAQEMIHIFQSFGHVRCSISV